MNDDGESSWGTAYGPWAVLGDGREVPARSKLTLGMVEVWEQRARSARNPYLRRLYADLVWDLAKLVGRQRRPVEFARLSVDALIEALNSASFEHAFEAYRAAKRAFSVATLIKDQEGAAAVEEALFAYERGHAKDEHAGTWGASFDLLLDGSSKLSEARRDEVVADMEARLSRAAAHEAGARKMSWVEPAATRLASHYRNLNRNDDVARVLRAYAAVVRASAKLTGGFVAGTWTENVRRIIEDFGLKADADALVPELQAHNERGVADLKPVIVPIEHDQGLIDGLIDETLEGSVVDALRRLTIRFIPEREH
ncbi:MAG: hypothetical protein ACLPJH_04190, partial [Myxococcaceae bacterium]